MSWAIVAEGETTTTPGVEQVLGTDLTNGTYALKLDAGALVGGGTPDGDLKLRAKTIVRQGGPEKLERLVTIPSSSYPLDGSTDAKAPIRAPFDPPIVADVSAKFTMEQASGGPRPIVWKILKAD